MNQKNPPQVLRSEMRADSVPVDEHYSTEGYFYDNPILTRTGIFKYKLEDGSERRELRRPEDVFDPASLASYEGKPIIITHDAQAIDKYNARRERVGTILTPGQQDGETVRAKIVIDDPDAVKASGLRELSVGYYQDLIMEPGEWEGEPYDAIQTHIRVNHLALVAVARAGDDARLNMDGQDNGGTDPMDDENKKTCTTMDDDTTVEPDKQTADDGEGASPAASSLDPAGIEAAIKANAKSAIDEIKDYAKKTLGVLGIGFSLAQLRSLAEEFGGINDAIRGATRELGDQSEIQQKILKGAQDCREEYGAMAGSVTKLIQQNGKLFPVDDAVKFVSLVEKLEKGAGREANIDSTMDVLTEAMSSGKLDKTGFANLKSKAPEVVNAISSAVGVSEAQLQKLAESGKLSAKQLKDAFFVSESEIQKNFDELGFDITDALKYVRNEWGLLIADLDDTFGITTRIGKAIRDGSDFLIGKAQKFTSWLKSVSDKLGGVEQLLKLIALAAAALFLATNGNMVLSFLSGAVKLLKGFNVQTALAAAKWLLLFLVLEDVFTFLQGGDSVLGRFLSDAGVDVDALRDKISNFFSNAKQFGKDALGDLKQFWNEHGDSVLAVLQWLWQGCVDLTADIVTLGGHLFDLLGGLITGFQTGDWTQFLQGCKELWQDFLDLLNDAGRIVFGELWDPLVDSMNGAWNLLKGFFNWFGEKIQWAKNLWSGIKGFFDGNDGDGDGDGDGTTKPNPKKRNNGSSGSGIGTAVGALASGGNAVSSKTVMTAPLASQTTNNKSINVKQENKQQYTFQVTERAAADRLSTTVRSQETQSTDELARALNYGR